MKLGALWKQLTGTVKAATRLTDPESVRVRTSVHPSTSGKKEIIYNPKISTLKYIN